MVPSVPDGKQVLVKVKRRELRGSGLPGALGAQ
jgi:hypothetical protein